MSATNNTSPIRSNNGITISPRDIDQIRIEGNYLVIPERDNRPAQYFKIGIFKFQGGAERTKLTTSEMHAILNMAKVILEGMERNWKKPLKQIKIDIDAQGQTADVTRVLGKSRIEKSSRVDHAGVKNIYDRVSPIFERSTRHPPLNVDNLVVDDSFKPISQAIHMSEDAIKAARMSDPIFHEHRYNNVSYGSEIIDEQIRFGNVAEGTSVLKHSKDAALKTIEQLEHKKTKIEKKLNRYLQNGKGDPQNLSNQIDRINADIVYYTKKLRQIDAYCTGTGKEWLDSDYWRGTIRETNDYYDAAEGYISAPINMRYHSYTTPGANQQTVGMMRCGVISDMRNGWFSLRDLKEIEGGKDANEVLAEKLKQMAEDFKNDVVSEGARFYQKKMTKRETELLEKIQSLSKDDPEVVNLAKEFQSIIQNRLQKLQDESGKFPEMDRLEYKLRLQSIHYGLERLIQVADQSGYLQTAIEDRRRVLGDQMLQLVSAQMIRHPEYVQKDADGNPIFKMAHVGFLDRFKHEFVEGWMHDEAIEMSDMAAIFNEFDGMKIVFDNKKGPSVEYNERCIYLPVPANSEIEEGEEVTLKTYFTNIAVQSSKDIKNDGVQKKINDDGLLKLKRDHKNINSLRKELGTGQIELASNQKSGYKKAEDLMVTLLDPNRADGDPKIAVSGGCLSVKDRTGIVCARVVQRFLQNYAYDNPSNESEKACKEFANSILDWDKPAAAVVFKNTGIESLKTNPLLMHDVEVSRFNRFLNIFKTFINISLYPLANPSLEVMKRDRKHHYEAMREGIASA